MMQRLPDLSGAVYMISIMISSMIERRPLAPVCLSSATLAISLIPKIGIQVCSASCLSLSLQKKALQSLSFQTIICGKAELFFFLFSILGVFAVSFFPAFKSIFVKAGEKISCRFALPKGDKT